MLLIYAVAVIVIVIVVIIMSVTTTLHTDFWSQTLRMVLLLLLLFLLIVTIPLAWHIPHLLHVRGGGRAAILQLIEGAHRITPRLRACRL